MPGSLSPGQAGGIGTGASAAAGRRWQVAELERCWRREERAPTRSGLECPGLCTGLAGAAWRVHMAGRGSRLVVRQDRAAWGSLVAWEVYKRMATLEYVALFVVVESWSGEELGWSGISWVRSKAVTWHRWNAVTPKALPSGSFSTRASLMFRLSKIAFFLDRMYLESMLVISS